MKKIILAFTFLSVAFQGYSQSDAKGYIGIAVGPSIPSSDFASKSGDNKAAGFATTGVAFDISFAYKLGKGNFGLTAMIRAQSNSTDEEALADELGKKIGSNVTVESGAYSIGGLMVGGFHSSPLSEKISLDTRMMIGFLNSSFPEITATLANSSDWVKQSSASATSFAYLVGTGLKFSMGKKLYLLTNLDYLSASPMFENVETISNLVDATTSSFTQSMGTFNFTVGLALKL